jgi:poly-beta-1,6-N-acetyl-D-glucosamine synthase
MIRCSIGVLAYNEEEMIIPVLHALLAQRTTQCVIEEIIVVASGCTDRTAERAQAVAEQHSIIRVDDDPIRAGKAAAVNRLISLASGDIIVLVGADTLPDPKALEHLVAPFADPEVGMTGARVVPLNSARSFLGWAVHLLWHLHHKMALQSPKLGELVAFRNVVPVIPPETATDEVALEAALTAQGYRLQYVSEAIVYNYGPDTLTDFIIQRRRIFAGHLHIAETIGYKPVSMRNGWLVKLGLKLLRRHPPLLPRLSVAAFLEAYSRLLGSYDHITRFNHRVWRRVGSTKHVHPEGQTLHLAVVNCQNIIGASQLLHRASNIPAELGSLVWWDTPLSEAVFLLPDDGSTNPEGQMQALRRLFGERGRAMIAYRLVEFPAWYADEVLATKEIALQCGSRS